MPTETNLPNVPFLSVPSDVLTHIVLKTFTTLPYLPTLKDLTSLRSLLLTCRKTNALLSASNNPYLYGKIFRLMWEVDPIQRRFGSSAVASSALTKELQRRFCALKRIRERVGVPSHSTTDGDNCDESVLDLVTLFFMITENDGKNCHQIRDILGSSGVADLCIDLLHRKCGLLSETVSSHVVALVLALMWMNTEDSIQHEVKLGWSEKILDLLEPIVLGRSTKCPVKINITYFGLQCHVTFPSPIPYARLCTIERYDAIKRRNAPENAVDHIYTRNSWSRSKRFDQDCARLITISPRSTSQEAFTKLKSTDVFRSFEMGLSSAIEGGWSGGWYVPCQIGPTTVFMVYRAMQCQLREYVCIDPENSVAFADGGDDDEVTLARAWFNEEVEITENPTSLTIYDPYTARLSTYEPRSELHSHNIVDRIFIGETEADHGAEFGAYKFHGRIRPIDGKIALLRRPAEMGTDDLGTWLFHGYIYGENDFIGDWTNTSTAKDAPAGSGWFRLTRDSHPEFPHHEV